MVMKHKKIINKRDNVTLVRVKKTDAHVQMLFDLLKGRTHTITHTAMPSFEQHKSFVFAHPYRAWYLIYSKEGCVGSVYILKSNTVGISTKKGFLHYVPSAIRVLFSKHKPLPAVRSVRAATFSFNVAPSNRKLKSILKKMGARLAQETYVIP